MWEVIGCNPVMVLVLLLARPASSQARRHVSFRFDAPLWVGPGRWGPPAPPR